MNTKFVYCIKTIKNFEVGRLYPYRVNGGSRIICTVGSYKLKVKEFISCFRELTLAEIRKEKLEKLFN